MIYLSTSISTITSAFTTTSVYDANTTISTSSDSSSESLKKVGSTGLGCFLFLLLLLLSLLFPLASNISKSLSSSSREEKCIVNCSWKEGGNFFRGKQRERRESGTLS